MSAGSELLDSSNHPLWLELNQVCVHVHVHVHVHVCTCVCACGELYVVVLSTECVVSEADVRVQQLSIW